jgi:pyrroline-5-carboxylate reductase
MNAHIIGGGNLGASIAIGIAKFTTGNSVTVTRRNTVQILHLEQLEITVSKDNQHNIIEC